MIREAAFFDRPIPLRHPFAFYAGHIPAFSFLTLNERSLGEEPIDPRLERLFERGIDPANLDQARRHDRSDWPDRATIAQFGSRCDERVLAALAAARIEDSSNPRLVRAQAAYTILEHENMHHETLMYIIHQLAYDRKHAMSFRHEDHDIHGNAMRAIPAGIVTLGADADSIAFGWDNEFPRDEARVEAFEIQEHPVTNGDWLDFVAAGGPAPFFWHQRDGEWFLRLQFEEIPLPQSWPVYVTNRQARAYAAHRGMRLPTEAEYHRAAFGTAQGDERRFPWGDERPAPQYGNFDFQRFDPEPVDAHSAGVSAWGVADLVGNGWEWTATLFAPLPGFEAMASYPQYSADFFDGNHYVMKGASPVTPRELIRRSFRNWFYDDYPFMYAKFRCVNS